MRKTLDARSNGASTALTSLIRSLRRVDTPDGIRFILARLVSEYGVDHAAFVVLDDDLNDQSLPLVHYSTYPAGWVEAFISNNYVKRDPVIKAFPTASLPYDWNDLERQSSDANDFFAHAHSFGIGRQGMSVPVRGTHGERSLFSVNCNASKDAWRKLRALAMFDWFVFAYFLHDRVYDTAGIRTRRKRPPLSRREWQCLQLMARGMMIKQIAARVGVSESAVRQYLRGAKRKLMAKTLSQAAAKAVDLEVTRRS